MPFQPGFRNPGGDDLVFSFDYVDKQLDSTSSTTQSVSISFGAEPGAGETRYIVCTLSNRVTSAVTVSSATIGGVAASIAVQQLADDNQCMTAIIYAAVPTGTSGTVSVTFSGTVFRMQVGSYRMMNPVSATPHATSGDPTDSSGVLSLNLNVPAGGAAVATTMSVTAGTTTWVGVTENYDDDTDPPDAEYASAANDEFASAQTPLTLTATCADTTPSSYTGCAASWG